jgi:hypothetical protein
MHYCTTFVHDDVVLLMHIMALNKPPTRKKRKKKKIIRKEEAIVKRHKFEGVNLGVLNSHWSIKIRSLVELLNIVGSLKS